MSHIIDMKMAAETYHMIDTAKSQGYDAGQRGAPSESCPFEMGQTDLFDAWIDGWMIAKEFNS